MSLYDKAYRAWYSALYRCTNSNDPRYYDYGGRSITMYEPWQKSFEHFLLEVGLPPTIEYQLDRKRNNEGYFPGNVHWTTRVENMRNTRRTKLDGFIVKTARDMRSLFPGLSDRAIAKIVGDEWQINPETVRDSLKANRGWR